MKNILVPTDFSPVSEQACAYALKIAEQAKAEIHFLHIQYTPVEWVLLDKEKEKNFPETLKQIGHARHELKKWEKRAKSLGLPVKKFLIFDQLFLCLWYYNKILIKNSIKNVNINKKNWK